MEADRFYFGSVLTMRPSVQLLLFRIKEMRPLVWL